MLLLYLIFEKWLALGKKHWIIMTLNHKTSDLDTYKKVCVLLGACTYTMHSRHCQELRAHSFLWWIYTIYVSRPQSSSSESFEPWHMQLSVSPVGLEYVHHGMYRYIDHCRRQNLLGPDTSFSFPYHGYMYIAHCRRRQKSFWVLSPWHSSQFPLMDICTSPTVVVVRKVLGPDTALNFL